jgi:phosphoribosyl-ATP pyrophosphohydrolase/phosphoribosyl-AMP cyclohydrolase
MTDRAINGQKALDALDFDRSGGLISLVAQDAATGQVLMIGFANRLAVEKTLETGQVHFWSRSRDQLWRKGETSGNTLELISLHADCDSDAVLALVRPAGPPATRSRRAASATELTCPRAPSRTSTSRWPHGPPSGRRAATR